VRAGVDHTRPLTLPDRDLLCITRDERAPDGLCRLRRTEHGLVLEDHRGVRPLPPLPEGGPIRDLQVLNDAVWISRAGAPALLWQPPARPATLPDAREVAP
jgi:hypothetical protein